ncbi:hypothetical protein Rsub_01010 [Raphidocelis subcapitata]|uniref:PsbP C-terminal domain-containing protein n=1 Tax=Raphidocelis subcapitata TaxID=307507 RepID=A0A2V0NLJ7_9CHLO|nr:hypothetical protein Rsub_01010 [Raphidocelis subcapitata]|eukprot:GBF88298.1 hypothetical protein Rsub_01010 [Raphidocelis subcapitata]
MAQQTLRQRAFGGSPLTAGSRSVRPHVICVRVRAARDQRQQEQQEQEQQQQQQHQGPSRRALLQAAGALGAGLIAGARPASAFTAPPAGYKQLVDKLDGYSFVFPELWTPVTTSGNDVFLRNPFNIEENLFVAISSPSSSRYSSVADLGTPEEAAKALLDQYLNKEFMSTRIGIRREGEVIAATSRTADDGRTYYDLAIRMASYASRNPYVATQAEVMTQYGLEWDRRLTTTLGVANNRLYELRFQSANSDAAAPVVAAVQQSFRVREVDV